ncbi:ankyrin [Exidia glandulosa HHB12029]|uniref:Ankyrin n=1 Tax=Exidia glandulosa HHB12029 TaxID=1314781 RepID=A0A166BTD7_EXIGL|nr:ankyrin [Exidia glandulosa HHB12029]
MKFGKQILSNQVPGWSAYYLDYKGLKKIVSSLTKKKLATNASLSPSIALEAVSSMRPGDVLRSASVTASPAHERARGQRTHWEPSANDPTLVQPPLPAMLASAHDDDRGPTFQEHKTAFFQKLEGELAKINTFYLQKEAELRLRLENMLRKRQAAAERLGDTSREDGTLDYVEWRAVDEGFRLLEHDLGKVQQFIEMNATGFRKILKKWDKRSKSTTKELYLSRQVEVMPCFNRQLIADMTDTVAACLLDVTNIPDTAVNFGVAHESQSPLDRQTHMIAYNELEDSFSKAIAARDEDAIRELLARAASLAVQATGRMQVTRILWRAIIVAPARLADIMLASNEVPFDFGFVDDINGRTCLHEAAIAGELRLVNICLSRGVQVDRADAYARTALHYAAIKGHAGICRALLAYSGPHSVIDPTSLDLDNYSPLLYACINGSSDCVSAMLDDPRVTVDAPAAAGDLMPLSLAAQYGYLEVVRILAHHNARGLPNTNGEYPIHLAARGGHADVCNFLVQTDACDRADKYNEWTPLFHAAENGHAACITVLLQAGCNPAAVDENGRTPIYYAAWNGHIECVSLLLACRRDPAVPRPRGTNVQISPSGISPNQQDAGSEPDFDIIPSLSLPPPIMPLRSYGHTYLLKSHLVVIALGHPYTGSGGEPLRLKPRLFAQEERHWQRTSPSLRLVISSKPENFTAPFEASLPIGREKGMFSFQATSLENLSLEFALYPSFGSRTLGKAVALPSLFTNMGEVTACVLPILDRRLHTIGEISFDIFKVSPLQGAAIAVSGGVETYWRSNSLPVSVPAPPVAPRSIGSAHTSPSTRSTAVTETQRGPTVSSLVGDFVHVVVQLTRDGVPVLCTPLFLPDPNYTLRVADVTIAQFQSLSARLGKNVLKQGQAATASEWQSVVKDSLISLNTLCDALPAPIGICIELAFASVSGAGVRGPTDVNAFVDAVLHVLYRSASTQHHHSDGTSRRKVALFSFSPDVCAAVNWKQPNYPVFFASACGVPAAALRSPLAERAISNDRRCRSIGAAVEFAKSNNLLGILAPATLLADVPGVSSGVKDSTLMLAVFGTSDALLSFDRVDASLCEGVLTVPEHQLRGLI